jgi:hypothetical protein
MTPNDAQIDVLLRRYAGQATSDSASEHLDADELSAFAQGALPPAARSRYVSHLADCNDCRRLVTQLTATSGAVARAEQTLPVKAESRTWWQWLAGLFAIPILRYAAFAAVVLIVAGVAFIALRRPSRNSELVASSQAERSQPGSAVKPEGNASSPTTLSDSNANPNPNQNSNTDGVTSKSVAPLSSQKEALKTGEDGAKRLDEPAPPPKPVDVTTAAPAPVLARKAGEQETGQNQSYAPSPPGERTPSLAGAQTGGVSGPRKSEQQQVQQLYEKPAQAERERYGQMKESSRDDNFRAQANQAPATVAGQRSGDEKLKGGPRKNVDNAANRNLSDTRNEATRAEAAKTEANKTDKDAAEEKAAETRSVGGRKFRRQGNAWVDQKFKPASMALKSVARKSDEFKSLDSGLQSIAHQLGGEIIVVWKGKAYLIK